MLNIRKTKTRSGFTLIELLVVISIIGLLSTLAMVALNSARVKSRDAKRAADMQQIQTAMALYFDTNGTYAFTVNADGTGGVSATCGANATGVSACTGTGRAGLADFMGGIGTVTDPLGVATLCTGASAAVCRPAFTAAASQTAFTITFYLEGGTGTLASGRHTLTERGIQ